MPRVTRDQLKSKISELETEVAGLKASIKDKESAFDVQKKEIEQKYEEVVKQKESEHEQKTNELNIRIEELEQQSEEKQKQLNKRELKKLAEAYKEQEDGYAEDAKKWFRYVLGSFVVLGTSISVSVYFSQGSIWYEKFEFYLINFVVLTFLIFSLKQFSYFVRLRTDYANRKTLAQSYHNILSSTEDSELKPRFLDKAADVLCAKNDVKHESYTLPEKLLETLADISKNLSKKI